MRVGPSGGMPNRKAFTLVELVVWLGVLAAFFWIGGRMLGGMAVEFRVRRAVREVAALLEWARWQAVVRGEALTVAFDPAETEISVLREETTPTGGEEGEVGFEKDGHADVEECAVKVEKEGGEGLLPEPRGHRSPRRSKWPAPAS